MNGNGITAAKFFHAGHPLDVIIIVTTKKKVKELV